MSVEWIKAMLKDDADVDDLGALVKEGEWINDAKYQFQDNIVALIDNKEQFTELTFTPGLYAVNFARSGSYWSDYEYDEPDVYPVVAFTETVTTTKYRRAG